VVTNALRDGLLAKGNWGRRQKAGATIWLKAGSMTGDWWPGLETERRVAVSIAEYAGVFCIHEH